MHTVQYLHMVRRVKATATSQSRFATGPASRTLHNTKVPTLLINNTKDETPVVALQPFFSVALREVEWVTLQRRGALLSC